ALFHAGVRYVRQRVQNEGCIAEYRVLDRVVLAEITLVDRGLHNRYAVRERCRHPPARQACSDGEDEVGATEEVVDHRSCGETSHAQRERMVLGDRPFTV